MLGIIILIISIALGLVIAAWVLEFMQHGLPGSDKPVARKPHESTLQAESGAEAVPEDAEATEALLEAAEQQVEEYFEASCYVHAHLFSTELEEPLSPRQKRFSLQAHTEGPLVDLREFLTNTLVVLMANLYKDGYIELERKSCEPLFPLVGSSRNWDVFVTRLKPLPDSSLTRFFKSTFDEFEKRQKRNRQSEFTLGELLDMSLQQLVRSRGWFGRKGIYFDVTNTLRESAGVRGLLHLPVQEKTLLNLKKVESLAVAAPEDLTSSAQEAATALEVSEQLQAEAPELFEGLKLVVAETLYTLKAMEPDPDSII